MKKRYKLEVRETKKYGKGVYAGEPIKKGAVIYVLQGEREDVKDIVNKINTKQEHIDDPFQIGKRTYIDLDESSRSFNHNCDPNAGLRKRSELFSLRDINENEEITYDYSMTVAPTVWHMRCSCGAKNCRKILGDVLTIPKSQMEKYKKLGAIPVYMKRLLKEIKNGSYRMPKYEVKALEKLKSNSGRFLHDN